MGEFSVIYLTTNFLYFMEHTSGHYWFYDPVMSLPMWDGYFL